MEIFRRVTFWQTVGVGTDQVLAACQIPPLCTMKNVWLNWRIHAAAAIDVSFVYHYGLSGFIVPVLDPDSQPTPTLLWDNLVPKDVSVGAGAFDLDTAANDTTPEFEVGEMDLTALFGFNAGGVEQFFRYRRQMDFVNSNGLGFQAGTPDIYYPNDQRVTRIKKAYARSVPSMAMFGVSHPSLDNTAATFTGGLDSPAEHEWAWLAYIEVVLERSWAQLQGIIETGAETPWEEAAVFLEGVLEPPAFEATADKFSAIQALQINGNATFQLSVPGRFQVGSLSSEG